MDRGGPEGPGRNPKNAQTIDTIEVDPLFIGDSRTYGMGCSAAGYSYIAKSSTGYNWLSDEGKQYLLEQIGKYPLMDIVFCFGVNDLGNAQAYIDFYNWFAAEYPEYNFYVMSVNPVEDSAAAANGYFARNSGVVAFKTSFGGRLQ